MLIKAHRVVVVNEFAYYTRTTTVMEHIREDVLLVVVVAPAAYDIVADALEQGTVRIALKFFDICNVSQELEEYVVTRELQKHFADFYAAYKKGIVGTTPKMGVWISGFFGSGKSHFLKILSYLLENRQVGERKALDYFVEDKKIVDPIVLADMKLAADTPTDVILFNIDSKSETNGKQNKDAIVNVFLKVFNQMQGFCGSIPHVADLERRLSEEGRYTEFKAAFEEEYGEPWEDSRQDFDFIQDSVVDTLVSMNFMSEAAARNWCEKAVEPYTISIEDFAKRVKDYIDSKGNNHHVVFLVDEIGQYIGDDSKLMLNLQTVTEELGKECLGKAWVIVTSQQDIDSITKVKGNDFSKIQGRFDTRLSLSSANVDAVIKKRILEKMESAAQALRLLYEQKATIIKNLIVFNDTVEKKLYANDNDFAEVYPFVSYQFNLLSSVLTSIRTHGASGKHLSGGERSMLALFKESAVNVMNEEMGIIVPFHRFYDALENFLDHSHSGVIIRAYDNSFINPEKKSKGVYEQFSCLDVVRVFEDFGEQILFHVFHGDVGVSFLRFLVYLDVQPVQFFLQRRQPVFRKIHNDALFDGFYDIIGGSFCFVSLLDEDLQS